MKPKTAALTSCTTDAATTQTFFHSESRQERLIQLFFRTFRHFLGHFRALFSGVTDPRQPGKITYPLAGLAFVGVLMYLGHAGARTQIKHLLATAESDVQGEPPGQSRAQGLWVSKESRKTLLGSLAQSLR